MSRIRLIGSETDLRAILVPRSNVLVREVRLDEHAPMPTDTGPVPHSGRLADSGSVVFGHDDGPLTAYERSVSWERTDEGLAVEQSLEFRLAIPYWGWLYRAPAGRALLRGLGSSTRPWWATPDRLSVHQAQVAAAVTLLNVVGGMLYGLLTQVLTFISADLGNGTSGEQTNVLALVRAGIIVTLVVSVLADRIGRRRMAIIAFCGSASITLVTALAPTLPVVAGSQFISRNLAIAALLCADTIAIEEMPAGSRAMIAGISTLAYGLGAGMIVMTLPLADLGRWGWRLTFLLAGCTLPAVLHCRRYLPESRRYQVMDLDRPTRPLRESVLTSDPVKFLRRLVLVGSIFVLLNVFLAPASQLQNDYLRTRVGFNGTTIAVFVLLTSTPGGVGVLVGGRVADRYGRRWAIIPALLALAAFNVVFFSSTNALMWIASLLASIIGGMGAPALAVITAELFPTVRRTTARGVVTGLAVAGSIIGLLAGGAMIDRLGYGRAFSLLAVAPVIAACTALALPRTHGRELEETSS